VNYQTTRTEFMKVNAVRGLKP